MHRRHVTDLKHILVLTGSTTDAEGPHDVCVVCIVECDHIGVSWVYCSVVCGVYVWTVDCRVVTGCCL